MYTLKSYYYKYKRLILILLGSICKTFIHPICFISCEINVDVLKGFLSVVDWNTYYTMTIFHILNEILYYNVFLRI